MESTFASGGRGIITKTDRTFSVTTLQSDGEFYELLEGPVQFDIGAGQLGLVFEFSDDLYHYAGEFFGCNFYRIERELIDAARLQEAAELGKSRREQYLVSLGFGKDDEIPTFPVGPCVGYREWYDSLSNVVNHPGYNRE